MSAYATIRRELIDRFRARGVERVVYFHCDHFEPWAILDRTDGPVTDKHVEDLHAFADDVGRIDYARRLTLFYRTHVNFHHDRSAELIRAHPSDLVGFAPRTPEESRLARAGMKYLVDTVPHEIQVHIHHEGCTYNTAHKDPAIVEFYRAPENRALDGERLSLLIRLFQQAIREETDVDLKRWMFVHGHWALQGSDDDSCNISDELAILMRHGCVGDFTFPAGRSHVNPRIETPYFCDAIDALRGYDSAEAAPEFAYGNRAAATSKFLIWSSQIKHKRSSIDYYAPWVRENLEKPGDWARDIVDQSFVVDGTLFFKTHSHSMFPYYREQKRRPLYPHAHPGVQTVISLVLDSASLAGASVAFETVSQVYDRFVTAEHAPADGYAIAFPGAATPARRGVVKSAISQVLPGIVTATTRPALDLPLIAEPARPDRPAKPPKNLAVDAFSLANARPQRHPSTSELDGLTPLSIEAAHNLVNEAAVRVTLARIEALGEAESGAYNYYSVRVKRGEGITDYETKLVHLLAELPEFAEYHEIGSGLGVLAMQLAMTGRHTVGVEFDRRRHAAGIAIYDDIVARRPDLAARCALVPGRFPDVMAERDVSRSVALLTAIIATTPPELARAFVLELKRYAAVLVDFDRFLERRETEAQRAELVRHLMAEGFTEPVPILDLGDSGRYYMIVNAG